MMDAQRPLYVYVSSLMGGISEADDVLQEVNLVLWRKMSEFTITPGDRSAGASSFLAWAYRIARFQVMAHLKKLARDRRVFRDDVLDRIAAHAQRREPGREDRIELLDRCLEKLPARQREYLELRYRQGLTVPEIADRLSTTHDTVLVMLCRARWTLQRQVRSMLNGV
jgi:RNA polymerase sigma-70 factor (ECF subfamily)